MLSHTVLSIIYTFCFKDINSILSRTPCLMFKWWQPFFLIQSFLLHRGHSFPLQVWWVIVKKTYTVPYSLSSKSLLYSCTSVCYSLCMTAITLFIVLCQCYCKQLSLHQAQLSTTRISVCKYSVNRMIIRSTIYCLSSETFHVSLPSFTGPSCHGPSSE